MALIGPLPKEDERSYNLACRHYDNKDHYQAMDVIQKLIKKHPSHAESIALKALILQGYQTFIEGLPNGASATRGKNKNSSSSSAAAQKTREQEEAKTEGDPVWKEDPFVVCKAAIQANFKSVQSWRIMGSLHRNNNKAKPGESGNYVEALKCYKQAVKIETLSPADPESGKKPFHRQLMDDAVAMSVQLRDWDYLLELAQRFVNHQANIRKNWVLYSVAHYMLGNLELASAVADTACKVMDPGDNSVQINEMLLYRAMLKVELKDGKSAVHILTVEGGPPEQSSSATEESKSNKKQQQQKEKEKEKKDLITDRPEKLKLLGKAYSLLNNKAKARQCFEQLLELREAERDVLYQLASSEGIKDVEALADPDGGLPREVKPSPRFCELLDEMSSKFPKCDAAKRIALDYCDVSTPEGEAAFVERLKKYIVRFVRDLVPSLVTVLDSLYVSSKKVGLIEKTFLEWQTQLEKSDTSAFDKNPSSSSSTTSSSSTSAATAAASGGEAGGEGENNKKKELPNPTFLLGVYEFLSAHYAQKASYKEAHEYIDKAIDHTPTHEVLYLSKARIYNAQRMHKEAAEYADKAQLLDLQDKYLNNKATHYLMRAGDIENGERILALFFKPSEIKGYAHLQSCELQYTWYERAIGCAYLDHKKDYINALKHLLLVDTAHRTENHDEVADFHQYAMRRNIIRQWIDVIRTADEFSSTKHFQESAPHIIRAFIGVHDVGGKEAAMSEKHHTPRPRPLIPEVESEERPEEDIRQHDLDNRVKKLFDPEIINPLLDEPLESAMKYVSAMQKYRKNDFESHFLAFEVHVRAERYILCASALAHVHRIIFKEKRGGSSVRPGEEEEKKKKLGELKKQLEEKVSAKKNLDSRVAEIVKGALAKIKV